MSHLRAGESREQFARRENVLDDGDVARYLLGDVGRVDPELGETRRVAS